ncbi:MAG: SDR family NAD(P)-dependent oxidoreductase, partial [Deferribacterales bacterium]|nr:SDR family NAD(P)-dependent oxidoreductase [Deferribacterales bacterium]
MRLKDKVAIITGGARGLGKAMVEVFTKEGAKVIAVDVSELNYENPNVEWYKLDITNAEACKEFFDFTLSKYGRIDVLVNNAG